METRRRYEREFKEQAVKAAKTGAKSVHQVAIDLGIAPNMLYRWVKEYERGQETGPFPGSGHARDEELDRLRKALRQAELERDILKKAVAFFAQAST
jgi:transposase